MENGPYSDQTSVFALLGELRADVKHILAGLERNKADMKELKEEVDEANSKLNDRLTRVEKFNTKVIAYASVLLPVLMIVLQWGIPALLALL